MQSPTAFFQRSVSYNDHNDLVFVTFVHWCLRDLGSTQ